MRFEEVLAGWRGKTVTQEEAALALGVSVRTLQRWIDRCEDGGMEALEDRRVVEASHRAAPVDEVMAMVNDYRARHRGWNVRHHHARYRAVGGTRSCNWVRLRLQKAGEVPPRKRRAGHRLRREPAPLPGMMLHQDASSHEWVAGRMWDLVVTMDDATNECCSMFLVGEEGTASSFRGVREVVASMGVFCSLYTDRASHYWFTPEAGGKVDKGRPTQFGRAMSQLGVEMIPAHSPEARRRSERMFGTLQGRLPQELALAGVADMAEANAFLASDCPPRHNAEFMRPAREQGSAYAPVLSMGVVDDILCGHHSRMVGRDNCVQFDGLALQVARIRGVRSFAGAKVTVRRHLNGFISVGHGHMTLGEYAPNGEPVNGNGCVGGGRSAPAGAP